MKLIEKYKHSTPIRLMVVTTLSVFIAEMIIMIGLSEMPEMSIVLTILIDSGLIVLFVLPILYYSLFLQLQKSFQEKTESDTKFKLLADHTIDLEYLLDSQGNYIYLSTSCKDITGYGREEFINDPKLFFSIIKPDYQESISNHYNMSRDKDAPPHKTEFQIICKNGEERWIEHNCMSVFDQDGVYIGRRGNNRDFTQRKNMEDALKKSEQRFKAFTNQTSEGITVADLDGNYVFANPAFCEMSGYTIEELLQMTVFDMKANNQSHTSFSESKDKMQGVPLQVNLQRKDKTEYVTEIVGNKIVIGDDELVLGTIRDITERKKTGDKLRKEQERAQTYLDIASVMFVAIDKEGSVSMVNQKTCEVLGYSEEEIIGKNWFDNFLPVDQQKTIKEYAKKLIADDLESIESHENTVITKENAERTIAWHNTVLRDESGTIIGHLSSGEDITERKQAEEHSREKDEYVHTILESTADGILAIDAQGEIRHTNQRFIEMWKIPHDMLDNGKDENLLKHVAEQLSDPDAFISKVQQLYQSTKEDIDILYFKDGRVVEIYSCPLKSKGFLDGRVCSFHDITERKKAEDANALLSRAIEQADETIVITDSEGKIQYVNPAFERASGYSSEEAIGQNPRVLKSGKHDDSFYKKMWDILSSGNQWSGEIINKKKDGTLYTENAVISPVFDSQGKIINYVAAKNDITETKRLQKLESRAERLEMAGTIAGQVAHDFNNLLAPIMAYPEFIRDELPHDNIALAYLDTIEKAAKKIADINQDLLTMGRRGHYNQEIININTIVLQAVKEVKARTATVTCETLLDEQIMNIKGGTAQIHRMLTNLLVNAYDAMDNIGAITIKTENYYADDTSMAFGRVPKGEYIKLTVTDNGCGIPDDIIQKILDPFFSTKVANKKSGSGLGLSVVDAVMKDHNGYLDLSSSVGKGTSFYLYFPITREENENTESKQLQSGTEKILIVDDDDVQREVTEQILKKLSYQISSVSSGEKAVEFLKNSQQDLVILDMMMPPGIDGSETYRQILEINANQKAIIVSGFSESDRVFEAQGLGVGAFVRKPFTKLTISAAVRTELERNVEETTNTSS